MKTKICSKCKKDKPISEFYRDNTRSDKLQVWCKDCRRYYKQLYRKHHKGIRYGIKAHFRQYLIDELTNQFQSDIIASESLNISVGTLSRLRNFKFKVFLIWTIDKLTIQLLGQPSSIFETLGDIYPVLGGKNDQ